MRQWKYRLGFAAAATMLTGCVWAQSELAITVPEGWRMSGDPSGISRLTPLRAVGGEARVSIVPPTAAQGGLSAQAEAGMRQAGLSYKIVSSDVGKTLDGFPVLTAYGTNDRTGARAFFLATQRKGQFSMLALEAMTPQALEFQLGPVSEISRHWLGVKKERSSQYEQRDGSGYATAGASGSASGDQANVQTWAGRTGNGGVGASSSSSAQSSSSQSSRDSQSSSSSSRDSQTNSSRDSSSDRQERIVFDGSTNQFRMVRSSEQKDTKISGAYVYENSSFGGSMFASSLAPLFARVEFDGNGNCLIGSPLQAVQVLGPTAAKYSLENGALALTVANRAPEHHSFLVIEAHQGVATKLAIGGCIFNRQR